MHFTADIVSPFDNGAVIYSTGTIDSDQTEPEGANTTETLVQSGPDFTVATHSHRDVGKATAAPGGIFTFTIYYRNTGNMDATGVVISDVVDASLENIVPADSGSYDAGTRTKTWNIGDVAVDDCGTVSFTADIVSTLDDGTIIYSTGTTEPDQTDPADTNTTQTLVESVPPPPVSPAGSPSCPKSKYLTVDWQGNNTSTPLYSNNKLMVDLLGSSPDLASSLYLRQATHAPVVDGTTYYLIAVDKLDEYPTLSANTQAIAVFKVTPTGAVFDKDISLTLGLTEAQLPAAGKVTMVYYDDINHVWVPLNFEAGGRNGVAELTLSAPLTHFSIYGVLAQASSTPIQPAHFVSGGLSIETSVDKIWEPITFVTTTRETVTIITNVFNDGYQSGTFTAELKLNGQTVDTKTVTVGAGQSRQVTFTQSGLAYGQYNVEVSGLTGQFTTSRTIAWWLIAVIVVALGLIVWGVVRVNRRRRPHPVQ